MARTLKDRLLRGSIGESSIAITDIVIGLIMLPFLLRVLGEHFYGMWLVVGTVIGFFGVLNFGLSSAAQRYITKYKARSDLAGINTVLSNATLIFAIAGIIAILASVGIWAASPRFFDEPNDAIVFQKIILLMGLKVGLTFPSYAFSGLIIANLRHDVKSLMKIGSLIFRTAAILVWVKSSEDIVLLALITCIADLGYVVGMVAYAISLQPGLSIHKKYLDRKQGRELFNYSAFSFVIWLADQMRHSVDNFVIAANLSLSAVAIYSVPLRLVTIGNTLVLSFLAGLTPLLTLRHAAGDVKTLARDLRYALELSACMGFTIAAGVIILGEQFIWLWVQQSYNETQYLLWIFAFITILGTVQSPLIGYLLAVNKHKHYALQNTLDGVMNLALSLILVRYYGLIGVALGTVIPMIVTKMVMQPVLVFRLAGLKLSGFYILYLKGAFWLLCCSLLFPWLAGSWWPRPETWFAFAVSCAVVGPILLAGFYALLISPDLKSRLIKLARQ